MSDRPPQDAARSRATEPVVTTPIGEMTRAWRDLHRRIESEEISTAKAAELWVAEFGRSSRVEQSDLAVLAAIANAFDEEAQEEREEGAARDGDDWDDEDPGDEIEEAEANALVCRRILAALGATEPVVKFAKSQPRAVEAGGEE
jgi:hypothetical protein